METTQIKKIIEAALLASSQPMSVPQLEALFAENADDPVSHDELAGALEALGTDCDERGIELVEVASGFRFQVRQEVHPWVARMWTERPSRYSRALLETLALIAYRQPITRGEIEQVRGVTVSSHIIKTLEEREWIRVVGHRDAPGRPALFGTTRTFLDYFNLKSLDELPPLADILNLEDLDPQLALGDASPQVGPPEPADADTATDTEATAEDEAEAETDGDAAIDADAETEATTSPAADETDIPDSIDAVDDDAVTDTVEADEATDVDVDADTDPTPSPGPETDQDNPDADPANAGQETPEEDRA